jgi:secreted trypsin-like serine protease
MPKGGNMTLGKVVTLAIAVIAVQASPAGAAAQPRIVGGGSATITDFPYQAALVYNPWVSALDGQFCGATIRDPTHVITAAHCVYDNPYTPAGQAIRPADVDVLVGTDKLSAETLDKRLHVAAVSFHPDYDPSAISDDAAVLTLAAPIVTGPDAALLPIIDSGPAWAGVMPGTPAWVSGWGATAYGGPYPDGLQKVQVPLVSDDECNADYGALGGIDPPVMVCAGASGLDSCYGDSGGPLALETVVGAPADRLIGIVSFGPDSGCGQPGFPGVYTEVAEPGIRSFVTDPAPVSAPRNDSRPTIAGTAQVGQTLTCDKGIWTGPDAYDFQFAGGTTALTPVGPQTAYTLTSADVGRQIVCYARGRNAGGYAIVHSLPTGIVQSAPATTPQPVPVAPAPPTIQSPQDTTAPVARIVSASCSKRWFCVLRVRVTDAGFSTGIRALEVRVTSRYRSTCRRDGKRVGCTRTRTRTLRASRTGVVTFSVLASGLPVGTHRFTVSATDNAGHRQLLPAVKTLKTKAAAKRRG